MVAGLPIALRHECKQVATHQHSQDRRRSIAAQFNQRVASHRLVPRHYCQHVHRFGIQPHHTRTRFQHLAKLRVLGPQPHHPARILGDHFVGAVIGQIAHPQRLGQLVDLLRTHATHQAGHPAACERFAPRQAHKEKRLKDRHGANAAGCVVVVGVECGIVQVQRRIHVNDVDGSLRITGGVRIACAHHRRKSLGQPVNREAAIGRRGVEAALSRRR